MYLNYNNLPIHYHSHRLIKSKCFMIDQEKAKILSTFSLYDKLSFNLLIYLKSSTFLVIVRFLIYLNKTWNSICG